MIGGIKTTRRIALTRMLPRVSSQQNAGEIFALVVAILFAAPAWAQAGEPVMEADTTDAGTYSIAPSFGTSGTYGTWVVKYVVGNGGIATGGGVRVQLPDEWHAGPRNSANRLQTFDPADDHFVTASTSNESARISVEVEEERSNRLIKHAKPSLDGRIERYVFVVRVKVTKGALENGDAISVTYGDTTGGSRGYRAAAVSTAPLPVLLALDVNGDNRFRLHRNPPRITSHPGPPREMAFHGPSFAEPDKPVRMLVSMVDKENNPSRDDAEIDISLLHGEADYPRTVSIPEGQGYVEFEVTPRAAGRPMFFRAVSDEWSLDAASNPMMVSISPPPLNLYWGDLHSHTEYSWDGVGTGSFDYARYVAGLDFYTMTDHSQAVREGGVTRGLSEAQWEEYTALTKRHHDPPRFVTLYAYECSFGRPYGHHNVFFRGEPGPLAYPSTTTLPELWKLLVEGEALTIPHHTGKFPSGVDFGHHDPRLRRNFEIYSAHGLSEYYNPRHPLAFEYSRFTAPASSLNAPTHAQDVWAMGLELSTVAASDDHRAQPGQPHWGLTAVWAPERTREAIFDGLYERRTYGTTGIKALMDFRVNGTGMGQFATVDAAPEIRIEIMGTDAIARVELLRHQAGEKGFQVIRTWNPDEIGFQEKVFDEDFRGQATYYLRMRQARNVRDRVAMAWSSPIWVRKK